MKLRSLIKLMKYYDWHIVLNGMDIAYYNFGDEKFIGTPNKDNNFGINIITRNQLKYILKFSTKLKFWGIGKLPKIVQNSQDRIY